MHTRPKLRGALAAVLVVVGSLGLVVASAGWWLERSFLNTSHFTGTANELLDQPEIQSELTAVLVRQISNAAGTDLRLAEPFLAVIVTQVIESDAFRSVFDAAVSTTHRIVVDRNTRTIVLDLTAAYDQVKTPLEQVAPKLARQLPSRHQLEVVVLQRSQLSNAWNVIDDVKRGVLLVGFAAVMLVALGVALAQARWRALARAGWVVAGGSLGLLGALWIGRLVVEDRISDGRVADAFGAGFGVITSELVIQSIVVAAVAAVVALAASFTAIHGLGAWRPTFGHWWGRLRGMLPSPGSAPVPGATWLARSRLPRPRVETRTTHAWRALALLGLGGFTVLNPGDVARGVVVVLGLVVLYLALTEGVAAAGSPPVEPR